MSQCMQVRWHCSKGELQNDAHMPIELRCENRGAPHALRENLVSPFSKKPMIWFAAATPALLLASVVCAPIFFLVTIARFIHLSPTTALSPSRSLKPASHK